MTLFVLPVVPSCAAFHLSLKPHRDVRNWRCLLLLEDLNIGSAGANKENLAIESIVFSIGLAVLVAYSKNRASSVRGIFGKGLKQVL